MRRRLLEKLSAQIQQVLGFYPHLECVVILTIIEYNSSIQPVVDHPYRGYCQMHSGFALLVHSSCLVAVACKPAVRVGCCRELHLQV
jgi:hypothetical protein